MAMEVPSEWEAIGMSAFRTPAAALLWTRPPEGSDFILGTTFPPELIGFPIFSWEEKRSGLTEVCQGNNSRLQPYSLLADSLRWI